MRSISVCYVLSYYIPDYTRSTTLIAALTGIEGIRLYQARNSSRGIVRYFETLWKLVVIRMLRHPDFYLLGFRGYELFWFVRLITIGRPLILDHMMSPYDSLVNEHRSIRAGGALAKLVFLYEKAILHASQVVLTDTDLHKEFFLESFHLAPERMLTIPVGADEGVFQPGAGTQRTPSKGLPFEVLFYGSFVPLHGVDIILKAASLLRELSIHFTLIGGWKADLAGFYRLMEQLELVNITHIDWVESGSLPAQIAASDVGLGGPFGNTGQARRVITGKTFQFLAMAKPVIVGAIRYNGGFQDKVNCLLVPQGDEKALADAISWAFHHRTELAQIGQKGYDLYRARYSVERISERIMSAFPS